MADMTRVSMSVRGAEVVTVPIDDTLTIEGQAADAKAVGDKLALKADKSELQAAVKVNNQPADAQGLILIDGRHIPVSDEDAETLAEAVTDLKGQTAENIPMSSDSGAKTIAEVVNANAEAIESMEEMTGATMPIESGSQTTVKAAIEARVKTVNRKAPDADGDVDLSVVPLAENLQSDKMESVEGSFIIRTTGGNASVSDGKAYPLHLFGSADHAGYVAEQLNMTVIPITRTEPDEPITATIDRDTFVAYVDESSTINLYYTTEWSADPELYGITVTGTPEAGDQITVVYVKEVRGTITVANPARLVGTGWNLFDYNNGYARVVKYSTEYGYKIGGSYASLQFSATLTGERSSITPGVDGLFNVPSDGYVFVTGGNNTDTYILTTWSDWMEGPSSGYWEPYRESGIDLSAVMTTYFPNGLLAVGTTRDEIDLSAKRSISRIERMAYSEENRAAAAASGRSYDFDQNYIYIVRESAVISAITIDTTYNVSEHGLEWFTETTLPVISEILYGKNLRDKLERDVVTISAQTLTEEEKAQVRTNIGAMSQADGDKKLVAPTTAGTAGQLLHLNADGGTEWTTQGTPTDAQVGTAVSAWLTAHPEATTTVEDGAISRAKLNDDLKAKTDAVPDLKSAIDDITDAVINTSETGITSTGTETGAIETDGTIDSNYNTCTALSFIVEPSTLYRFRGTFLWNKVGIAFYDSNNTFIEYKESNNPPQATNTHFNSIYRTPANCTKVKVSKVDSYTCSAAQIVYTNNLGDDVTTINNTIGDATLKTKSATLKAGTNENWDAVCYISDKIAFNEYLQNLFVLFRWNDTYGYVSDQTGMSIIAAQKFPYDVEITNLHYPDFVGAYVKTFSSILATPANLVDTISYTFAGDGAVSSIILPKDTYWTVQFTRPGNANIDLTTYKIIPNFIAGDNINFTSQLKINNTHVVGKKFAQYTKIQDAVDAASSGDTIYILPGTYEEAVSAWGKELHFVGFDRDSTIILEKSGLYSTPPLEVNIGSVRNLTLIETGEGSSWGDDGGKGRAYAVHIENGDGYTGVGELWFDNCKLINYAHAAIGCGLYQDLHVHFNNCYMYSGRADDVLDDYYRGTFYYHTCVAEDITGQQMTVKDCEIINEGTACFFGGVTPNATSAKCRSTFINNNFFAMSAQTQNTNDIAIVYNILNFHDCKLNGNSRGNNIPALNAP